ncbi:MAG: required for respiratory growth mitochondrial [Lasallia pustulata]|uniref:Required for respiratory growth protein 9, mitochondrial n=1 Tax=Lasallia pustulata TaxID=136370 RepID=A0A5M8Q0A8_9LECA|nr:MAG: required for respiratory growth mitochondrial [Lasallia pustulata]
MSCAACSTKSLRSFLRGFHYLEAHDTATSGLSYNVQQATRRPFNTSSSQKYQSSLRAGSQLQLSELTTKPDDAYLPFVKLPADTEVDKHIPRWPSASAVNPQRPSQRLPAESLVVADQSVESRIGTSRSPSLNPEIGGDNNRARTRTHSESGRNSTSTYGEEKRARSGTKFRRGGKAAVAQQRPHKEASQRVVAMTSTRCSSRPLDMGGAGHTSLKPARANGIRETIERSTRGGGARRANGIAGSVQAELGKRRENRERELWQSQKSALAAKFGAQGWAPRKRLSPDALEGIRALHAQYPEIYTTPVLADQFKVSPEAVRRILKSKWRPNEEEEADRRQRWDKRGESIWSQMVELGIKPPKKWREMGIGTDMADSTKTKKQNGPKYEAQRSGFQRTDSGEPEPDTFMKGSLGDRIL